jgi:TRAP-type mannitol/chloroaromatic compound transport system permease small subunit
MTTLLDRVDRFIKAIGNAASLLIIAIMGIVTYEVIARYVFNAPTSWAWLINKQLFGVFVLIAGGYTMIHENHIRIEMLSERFPSKVKNAVRWLTLLAGFCFLGALLWKSCVMGLESWQTKEVAVGVFRLPLYPLKLFMPVAVFLFLLGCITTTLRKK